jgi:hypothetical protein
MIAPPRVMETNERTKPVLKNRQRIQASVSSSNPIAASASSSAARYCGMRNGSACRMPPANVPPPVIAPVGLEYTIGVVTWVLPRQRGPVRR